MSLRTLIISLVFLNAGCSLSINDSLFAQSNLILGVTVDKFTINGKAAFLLGVSYFDGRNYHESDLRSFSAKGFNLIRIWLDWRTDHYFDGNGNWLAGSDRDLLSLVDFANTQGLIVDVTILDDNAPYATSPSNRRRAVQNVTNLLKDRSNVLFDLVNEHDHSDFSTPIGHGDAAELVALVKQLDPDRIVTISSTGCHIVCGSDNINQNNIDEETLEVKVDVLTPHFLRSADWADKLAARVRSVKARLRSINRNIPIYLQEENRRNNNAGSSKDDFIISAHGAFNEGAAAWIFHTKAGFEMRNSSFFDNLDPTEFEVVDELAARVFESVPDRVSPNSPRNLRVTAEEN